MPSLWIFQASKALLLDQAIEDALLVRDPQRAVLVGIHCEDGSCRQTLVFTDPAPMLALQAQQHVAYCPHGSARILHHASDIRVGQLRCEAVVPKATIRKSTRDRAVPVSYPQGSGFVCVETFDGIGATRLR
jgi:hypothetical protein